MKQKGESSISNYEESLLQRTDIVIGCNYQSDLCRGEGTSCTLQHFQNANIRDTTTLSAETDIQYLEQNPFSKLPFRIIKAPSQDEDSEYFHFRSVFDIISISDKCAGSFRQRFKISENKLEQKLGSEKVGFVQSGDMTVGCHFEMSRTCTENERHAAAGCDFAIFGDDHVHVVGLNKPTLDDTTPSGDANASNVQLVNKIYDRAKQELLSLQVDTTIKDFFCMKCNKGGKLLNCKCGIIVHEKCLGSPIEIRNPDTFSCPFCTHRNAVIDLGKVLNNVFQTKERYNAFLNNSG